MRVGGHVDGNVVHAHGQIGAMIQIKSAQEILVGFAAAALLRARAASSIA